jgi:hypothetical protein
VPEKEIRNQPQRLKEIKKEWNIGMMGKELEGVNPLFHPSIITTASLLSSFP